MGQILHGTATTTNAIRTISYRSQNSVQMENRDSVKDLTCGVKLGQGNVLGVDETVHH